MPAKRPVYLELYVGGTWVDAVADRLERAPITPTRGYRAEAGGAEPSSCGFLLGNRSGNYSPRNPTGAHFGTFNANTPVRLGIGPVLRDTFDRAVSNGWGAVETGEAWTNAGSGGAVLTSDFQVTGSAGTHSVPAVVAHRISYLATTSYRDIEVQAEVSLGLGDVTGGEVEPGNIALRGQSTADYYLVRVVVTAAEAITIKLMHVDGTEIAAAVATGYTHSAGQVLLVRAQAEGWALRAKVWPATSPEPYGWQVTGHSGKITRGGWVGIRNGVASGNTNTKPITFSVHTVTVRRPRFAGELGEIAPGWDLSGEDVTAGITAAGILRRLAGSDETLASSLRRALTNPAALAPVAYWPCEDGPGADAVSSGLGNGVPMLVHGAPEYAKNTDFAASDALLEFNGATLVGAVTAYTPVSTGSMVRFLLSVPSGGVAADTGVIRVTTSGSLRWWDLIVTTGGALKMQVFNAAGTMVDDTGFFAFAVNGTPKQVSIEFNQNGANADYKFSTLTPGSSVGASVTDSVAGTIGIVTSTIANPGGGLAAVAGGHISVHRAIESIFVVSLELAAWVGERALERIERLCAEEGVPFATIGDPDDTPFMGAQSPLSLLDLITECADVDMGLLYEPRGELGIGYRTRRSLYNQDPVLELDYSAGQVSNLRPVEDDQLLANDVTVTRKGGGQARSVLETGPMSVLPPWQGGRGRYKKPVTLNCQNDNQLPDLAGWIRHLGTVDEARYPRVTVDLSVAAVIAAGIEEALLSLWPGDRVVITNPKAGQTPDAISQLAIGYAERINILEHTLTLVCAPESPYRVLELDSATDARLDSDATTLTNLITTTAASFQVTITDGSLWSTAAADWPIPVRIGGEVMSVGAVTGASSPQTFSSVGRSVNGVVKEHGAGTEVHVTNPVVLPF